MIDFCQINNTLQVILATDGTRTVSIFLYEDIQWGYNAQIGFNVGDGHTSFTLPEALSAQSLNVDENSNVGTPGVYVFQIDGKPCLLLIIIEILKPREMWH